MDYENLKPVKINKDLSPGLNPLGGTVGTRKDESYFNYQVENQDNFVADIKKKRQSLSNLS